MGSSSSKKAADKQAQAQREALAEQRRQFDIGQSNQEPFRVAGTNAVNELAQFRFQPPDAGQVQREPGYAFGLSEGRNALEGSAAARGGLFSGNALKALTRYGNDYASTKFNDAFERARSTYSTNANTLGNLVNAGTGAATQMQNAGANFASHNADMLNSGAQYQGAAGIAGSNAWGNAINQGISIGNRNNWWQGGGKSDMTIDPNGMGIQDFGAGSDVPAYLRRADGGPVLSSQMRGLTPAFADGGPVMVPDAGGRMVPKVGSRTPRPGSGTGGGMSREQVLAALNAAQAAASSPAPQPSGLAGLGANPVTNPEGVRRIQMEKVGAYADGGSVRDYDGGGPVRGPGGPRDDAIPAHLSNGEFVISAEGVTNLGGGNNIKGQRKLNALHAILKGL